MVRTRFGRPVQRSCALVSTCVLLAIVYAFHARAFAPLPSTSRALQHRVAASALDVAGKESIDENLADWEKQQVADEAAVMAGSDFPISADELIKKAKIFLMYGNGRKKPDLLSEGFEFVGPIVGPLSKKDFLRSLASFDIFEAFPDIQARYHHFRVDPFEPNRVWCTCRSSGTNSMPTNNPMFKAPTHKSFQSPPEAVSFRFDPDGKVNQFTTGYVMDRRVGNTGGLGGIFGIAYAVGKPFPHPEGQPSKLSWQYRLFDKFGRFLWFLEDMKKKH